MYNIDQDLITTAEAMRLTGYTQEYIRKLARDGTVESTKFGNTLMISRESLVAHYEKKQGKKLEEGG